MLFTNVPQFCLSPGCNSNLPLFFYPIALDICSPWFLYPYENVLVVHYFFCHNFLETCSNDYAWNLVWYSCKHQSHGSLLAAYRLVPYSRLSCDYQESSLFFFCTTATNEIQAFDSVTFIELTKLSLLISFRMSGPSKIHCFSISMLIPGNAKQIYWKLWPSLSSDFTNCFTSHNLIWREDDFVSGD